MSKFKPNIRKTLSPTGYKFNPPTQGFVTGTLSYDEINPATGEKTPKSLSWGYKVGANEPLDLNGSELPLRLSNYLKRILGIDVGRTGMSAVA